MHKKRCATRRSHRRSSTPRFGRCRLLQRSRSCLFSVPPDVPTSTGAHIWTYRQLDGDTVSTAGRNEGELSLRAAILERDGHRCYRCGAGAGDNHHTSNLATICRACHKATSAIMASQALRDRVRAGLDAYVLATGFDREHFVDPSVRLAALLGMLDDEMAATLIVRLERAAAYEISRKAR